MAQCWEVGRVKETLFSQWGGEERRRGRRGMTCRTQCYNKCYCTRMISYDVTCSVIYTTVKYVTAFLGLVSQITYIRTPNVSIEVSQIIEFVF